MNYTDESVNYLKKLKAESLSWKDITEAWNEKYSETLGKKTSSALEKAYRVYKDHDFSDDTLLKNLKTAHAAKQTSQKLRKENKVLVEHQLILDDIDESVKLLSKLKLGKVKIPKVPKSKHRTKMTIESFLSDIH
ncbi:MAG: hypothetical protein ACXACP_13580, partial [Candidatus Hodarchaeales archaeon]